MKIFQGLVVSLKNKNTAVVKVDTFNAHKKYKKVVKSTRTFQVHYDDRKSPIQVNSKVTIKPSRPFSATKRFIIVKSQL
jgi:small subunit ribosomal protein S17